MNIAISAETAVDLPKELADRYPISVVPFSVTLGDKDYEDGKITAEQIFEFVDKTGKLPKTGAVNPQNYLEHFKNLLKTHDAVIHFALSSNVSSTFSNAQNAAAQLKNVYVIDTKSLSTGIALQAIYAHELASKGETPEEIVKKCLARVDKVHAGALLVRIDYMYKGGRCNALQLFGANLLKIRVQITMKDGKMTPSKKYRGKIDACIQNYLTDVLNTYKNPDLTRVFITYTSAEPETVTFAKELLKKRGFKEIYEAKAGAAVTSHCGNYCFGIMFFTDGDNPDIAR